MAVTWGCRLAVSPSARVGGGAGAVRDRCAGRLALARSASKLADGTIRGELSHLDRLRDWLGRPLGEMEPRDADAYLGRVRARTDPRRLRAKKQHAERLVAAGITDTPESLR